MEPLTRDDPGQIAGYRLHARLGAGGMGRVYLGYTPGGRAVAVKVMRPELGDDRNFRDRFRQEIEAAGRVRGLYTAEVIDADPSAVPPWLVTAYVPGPSLQQAVADHGPLPAQTVYRLMAGVAEALQAIHAAGVVHRDLKPSNVLLAPDGPRVIDFGIARAAEATALTRTGFRVGSPQFMAPEQVAGQPTTPATDIFALGALAAYAVLGRAPFGDGGTEAVLYRILHQQPDLADCPASLRTVIERCLAKNAADRPGPAEIIWFCQAQLGPGQVPGHAAEIAQSWLPPGVAADLAYRATAVATQPAQPAQPAVPAPGPFPPSSVVAAVGLMYAGAASAVLNAIVGSVAVYGVIHNILEKRPNTSQAAVTTGTAFDVTLTIFFGLAGTGLWLWMAYANRNGRSWARILSTVLFAVLTVSLPLAFLEVPVFAARVTSLLQWALALSALVLLWVAPSNAYFAAMRQPADLYPPQSAYGPPPAGLVR
jgi:hypothetical protein